MTTKRQAKLIRKTKETKVDVRVNLDGSGKARVKTGIPFLDHMIESLAKHGHFDIEVKAAGDTHIDNHHTNEDIAITLGEAFKKALADKKGIRRFGDFRAPLDESLTQVRVSLDISGRGSFHAHTNSKTQWIKKASVCSVVSKRGYSFGDARHFFDSFASHLGMTLHMDFISGQDPHHVIESAFKALAKALAWGISRDPRTRNIPSTKGAL